jgi:hypothetical protein
MIGTDEVVRVSATPPLNIVSVVSVDSLTEYAFD